MMAKTDRLAALRNELFGDIERFASDREAAQSGLVREHLAQAKGDESVAGPLCLAMCRGLGLGVEEARQVAVIVGLVECAALALQRLRSAEEPVQRRHGLPLALNSADALYSLGQVALADYESSEGGRRGGISLRLDRLSLRLWEATADTRDALPARDAARIAGEIAAAASGREEPAIIALGEFAAAAALGLSTGAVATDALSALDRVRLSERERSILAALVH